MTNRPGEQRTNLLNVTKFALTHPRQGMEVGRKVVKRLFGRKGRYGVTENVAWIDAHSTDPGQVARDRAPDLWKEALRYGEAARVAAKPKIDAIDFDMGAGGDYEFLYWLTRHLVPKTIVETGVSAGWTSRAFLTALRENKAGSLYSSDFPYFRVDNPERFIGTVVEDGFKSDWSLFTIGDAAAVPKILATSGPVDLFHYDSDKSYSGKDATIKAVMSQLSPSGVALVDDIRDDSWFREYVERTEMPFTIYNGRTGLLDPNRVLV